jgi:hypothetical protein
MGIYACSQLQLCCTSPQAGHTSAAVCSLFWQGHTKCRSLGNGSAPVLVLLDTCVFAA